MGMCDDGQDWGAFWELHGIRADDDGVQVTVRVGVIDLNGHDTVAIGVADEPPVALTDRLTDEVAKLLGWAKDERDMLADLRAQQDTDALKDSLNRAVLTNRQWRKIRHALDGDNPSDHDMTAALYALRDAAPPDWTESCSDG